MKRFVVNFPVRIVFGEGESSNISDYTADLGRRALLVADPYWAGVGLTAELCERLQSAGIQVTVFSEISPNPQCADVDRLGDMARSSGTEFVIGLGGGSAIDTAKAVAIAATHEGGISDYVNWNPQPRPVTDATLPIVAIPTTSGTGAEATHAAVMCDPATKRKTAVVHERLYPHLALIDPVLSASMPPNLTAATGLDALSHALEALMNTLRRNPFADMVALEAVSLVARHLPRACSDGKDMEARAGMSWAATLGGMAIAQSGTTVPHALAQPLGARADLHHGLTIAVFLPAILDKSWEADPPLFARIATALGTADEGLSLGATARSVPHRVRNLIKTLGIDQEIAQLTIDRATAESIVQDASTYLSPLVKRHIQPLSREDLWEIVERSITVR